MNRRTSSRVAGLAFLVYIAAALTAMILEGRATSGAGTAAKLASIAGHATDMRLAFVLELISCFCALALAVTLYAITRDAGPDLALLGLTCRVAEGVIGGASLPKTLEKLWLATASGPSAPDPAAANALGAFLLKLPDWTSNVCATFFAVGSLLFACLLLRGRIVPAALAWLGVLASVLVVVCLPLELVGLLGGSFTQLMWMPMLAFEVPLALWLIFKGAAPARNLA